jgi:DNA replication protein DnaC
MVFDKIPGSFWAGKWDKSNIPVKFRGQTLRDYVHPHTSGTIARDKAEKFVDQFENHYVSPKRAAAGVFPDDRNAIGKGLLLIGPNGTRKSTLACAVLTEVQYLSPSYEVYYIRFSDWKKAMTDTFTKEDSATKVRAKYMLHRTEFSALLVLDDIGQEHRTSSGFTESSLHELLRVRYEAARPTIVTTNVSKSRFAEIYGDSLESFRHDAFDPLVIVSDDLRKTKN